MNPIKKSNDSATKYKSKFYEEYLIQFVENGTQWKLPKVNFSTLPMKSVQHNQEELYFYGGKKGSHVSSEAKNWGSTRTRKLKEKSAKYW